jgi:cytochrome P450
MQCFTTQRDEAIFHDPNAFNPLRWIQAPEKHKEMNLYQMPFSKGTRACLGMNLAMMELKIAVASLVHRYDVSVADSMKPGDMDMKDHLLAYPKGGKCDLVFNHIEKPLVEMRNR